MSDISTYEICKDESLTNHNYEDLKHGEDFSQVNVIINKIKKNYRLFPLVFITTILVCNAIVMLSNIVVLSQTNTATAQTNSDDACACCNSTSKPHPSTMLEPLVEIDMKDHASKCPPSMSLNLTAGLRTCIFHGYSGCSFILFPVSHEYTKITGKIIAYQYGVTNSFQMFRRGNHTIDEPYVDGISLTYGRPRQHIWTFAADLNENRSFCPCYSRNGVKMETPEYVGKDYFCDTGEAQAETLSTSPLWDGRGCDESYSCCGYNSPPWFYKQLPHPTLEPIELRVCTDQNKLNENIAIEVIAIYVFN